MQYCKDFLSAHVRIARLLALQPKAHADIEALEQLSMAETKLLGLLPAAAEAKEEATELLVYKEGMPLAAMPLRKEMSKICQAGLKRGEDVDRLKSLYRKALRNEPLFDV